MHRGARRSYSPLWTFWLVALFRCHQPSAASRVPGSQVLPREGPPLVGQDVNDLSDRLPEQPTLQPVWLTTSAEAAEPWAASSWPHSTHARSLLAGETLLSVSYSNASAVCPGIDSGNWSTIYGFGHQVSDNWLCTNRPTSPLHGASAQEFTDRPTWNTYGWAAFQVPARPAGSPIEKARVEGLNLLLIGNQGQGAVGNCTFSTVNIAIFADNNNAPNGAAVYNAGLRLGQAGRNSSRSFRYWGNYSSVISMDIVDKSGANTSSNPPAVELEYDKVYWLRVQVAAAYGAAKCFVSWVANSQVKVAGRRALWQEATGGAGGYSTSCTGAADDTLPAASQSLYSCFNGGLPGSGLIRRCLTYRNTVVSPISCPARFNDFSFSLWGNNAVSCAAKPALALQHGTWPDDCAGKKVYEQCKANCTWGPTPGSASTECLVTGEWSTTVTGQCEAPPEECAASPETVLTDGAWDSDCAGTEIGFNCTANCTWGPVADQSPTATCQSVPYGYPNITAWSITGACYDAPTNCSLNHWEYSQVANWPPSCFGKNIGENCTAECTWGASASGAPTSTCVRVPYNYPDTTNWTESTGECNPEPLNCSSGPSASLTNYGTWPSNCAGEAIGQTCEAECPGGSTGSMEVTCEKVLGQPDGQYNTSSLGTCNPVVCDGLPTSADPGNYGTWNASCANTTAPGTCSAICPGGGSATVNCQTNGLGWNSSVEGGCSPVFCTASPETTPANGGTWPNCTGTAAGGVCTASCPGGGVATSTCVGATASWNTTLEGECLPQCTTAPDPASLTGPGNWSACTGTFNISQTCNATCDYGGSAMVTCESSGNWSSPAEGKCLAQCEAAPTTISNPLTNNNDSWDSCTNSLEGTVCSATCAGDGAGTPVNTTCGADEQWGATSGTCPVICPDEPSAQSPPVTFSGSVTWTETCAGKLEDDTCTFTCTISGNPVVTCGSDGKWVLSGGDCLLI